MKNKTTAGILAIFLGGFGAHHFYLENKNKGIQYLLISLLGFGIGAIIIGIMSIIDAVHYFSMSDEEFDRTYNGTISTVNGQFDNQTVNNGAPINKSNKVEELKNIKELLDIGAITKEEFDAMKAKILSDM